MARFVVADIGNSRIKWGLCDEHTVLQSASLPLDDALAWTRQWAAWSTRSAADGGSPNWILADVNPAAAGALSAWLKAKGIRSTTLRDKRLIPIASAVDNLEQTGIDRLLIAAACLGEREPGRPCILAGAGSAITVDWLDHGGVFRGGAILPGLRMMAKALHDYTSSLPFVPWDVPPGRPPGPNTISAIACGIYAAAAGGILHLARELRDRDESVPHCWITGGDAPLLLPFLSSEWKCRPNLTLEGLRVTALKLQ
jgi:type III pantothenate kinase